ncbi:hypothetical protein Tco_1525571 [Tanacetum coccineum]
MIAEDLVEELAFEMASDDVEQTVDDLVNDSNQPHDDSTQTKDKTLKKDWFKQPPRPPTPYPKWNKLQVKASSDQLDWNNPEGDRYPYDLTTPLPLKGRLGRLTVPSEYFFNNDLEYLKSLDLEKKYTTSITKIKAARYELVGIEDMIPNLWSATNHNVYSTQKILSVISVKINKMHGYGHLEEIVVRRTDRQIYTFKEGDFVNLHLNEIDNMLFLVAQQKLFNLEGSDIVDLAVALRMFTRSLIIKRRVEDVQLGVESYQKKLNLTKPQQDYEDLNKRKRVMRADELYKFSDGTLKLVRDELHHRELNFCLGYKKEMFRRKWSTIDKRRSELMVKLIDKQMRERQIIRNLERLMGARELEMEYRLMHGTV